MMTLIEGKDYVDSSVFRFDGKWWLLTGQGDPLTGQILYVSMPRT
jgi:hypothetical protein